MLGLMAAAALADETVRLSEIPVSASPLEAYLPARTEIDRAEIDDAHKTELDEVLDLTPGLNARRGGRGEPRIDVRGFDQRAVLFTLDGVPVYEPWNGIINVNLFPLEALDGIEIVRGPSSALYGPNGIAGTVKLATLRPHAPFTASAGTIWRDSDFFDSRASGGVERGPYSAVLGGRFVTDSGFNLSRDFDDRPATSRRFEDGGERLNSELDEKSLFASASYRLAGGGRVHGAFLGSRDAFGIPPGTTGFAPVFRRTDEETLLHGQTGIEGKPANALAGRAALFYSRYTTEESEFDGPDFRNEILENRVVSDEIGGIGRLSFALHQRDELALGGLVRQSRADVSNTVRGDLVDPEVTTVSGGLENVWLPLDFATLVVGLSYDLQTGGGRGTDWELNPQGGLYFALGRYGEARVAVSRKTRFPTLRQLFDPVQGNDDLDSEKALVYEVGYTLEIWRAELDTAFFRSEVDDFVDSDSGGGGSDPQPSVNLGEARLQGVEFGAVVTPLERVALGVNYTFLDAEARGRDGSFSEIQHRPGHRFNGILRIFLPWETRLRLEGLYTSEQLDRFGGSVEIDDFALFNFDVAKSFVGRLEVFAGLNNALDVDYEERLGTPRPGRRAFIGLRASY